MTATSVNGQPAPAPDRRAHAEPVATSPCASAASPRSTAELRRRAGRGARDHRPERRRQDHALRRDRRACARRTRAGCSSPARHHLDVEHRTGPAAGCAARSSGCRRSAGSRSRTTSSPRSSGAAGAAGSSPTSSYFPTRRRRERERRERVDAVLERCGLTAVRRRARRLAAHRRRPDGRARPGDRRRARSSSCSTSRRRVSTRPRSCASASRSRRCVPRPGARSCSSSTTPAS